MSDDLTLPGELPGLLRYPSPLAGNYQAVLSVDGDEALVVYEDHRGDHGSRWEPLCALALDLTDPTGRVHAAWWAERTFAQLLADTHRQSREAARVLAHARAGTDMPDTEIATLRALCLRLAGRTP